MKPAAKMAAMYEEDGVFGGGGRYIGGPICGT
jgi:hypothetical protein